MEGRVGRSREVGVRTCGLSQECGLSRKAMGVVLSVIIPYTDEGTESHWEWLAGAEPGSQVSGAWGAQTL